MVLHSRLERDDHDVASLIALDDGRLAAFYTRHDGFPHLYTRHAEDPSDITRWGPLQVDSFDTDVTYTNPFEMTDDDGRHLVMFIRGIDSNPSVLFSDDGGERWSGMGKVMDAAVLTRPAGSRTAPT